MVSGNRTPSGPLARRWVSVFPSAKTAVPGGDARSDLIFRPRNQVGRVGFRRQTSKVVATPFLPAPH